MKILHKWQNIERVVLRHARKDNLGKERNCILDYSEDHSTFGRNLNANCLNSFIQKEKKGPQFSSVIVLDERDYKLALFVFLQKGIGGWLPLQSAGTRRHKSYRKTLRALQGPRLVFDSFCIDASERRINPWEGNLASAEVSGALSCIYNRQHLVFAYNREQVEHDSS